MDKMDFDEIIELPLEGETIQYGIVDGSSTIVFIKAGADGSMYGYKNKYLQIARNINKSHRYTVICSSNPYHNEENPLNQAIKLIANYAESHNFDDYEIFYMGHSDGAALGAHYGYLYPKIKRMILINSPLYFNWYKLKEGMKLFAGEKATFVYGDLDPSYMYVEMLDSIENEKIKWKIIPGADHHFKDRLEEFMNLPYEFLLS
jgi:hypothetical protein